MPSREFTRWRKRLQEARDLWRRKGLIGSRDPSPMRMLIEFYRSNQWQGQDFWRGCGVEEMRTVNKVFSAANTQQARVASRSPRTMYSPRPRRTGRDAAELEREARVVKALHDYDIREQNHKRTLNSGFRDHQFAPFGVVRHGYTPEEEMDGTQRRRGRTRRIGRRHRDPNAPWIERVAPWNVLLDPHCEFFHTDGGMRWCAFRSVEWKQDLLENPNVTASRDDLRRASGNIAAEWLEMQDPDFDERFDEQKDAFELWTVYEDMTRTWFQMSLSGLDDFVRKPDDWPIPWETLPVNVFSVNRQMDTPFAVSLMETQIDLQQEYNQVRTMMHQAVLRSRRFNFYSKQAIKDDEQATRMQNGEMGEWFGVDGSDVRTAVASVQTTGLPAESLLLLNTIEEDLREARGQSKMDQGQRINVESAAEAAFVQSGSSIHEGRVDDHYIDWVTEVEALYMQGRRHILRQLDVTTVVGVVGEDSLGDVREWVEVDPEELHGEWTFELEAGSTRRKDPNEEARKALADLTTMMNPALQGIANLPYWVRRYIESRGLEPGQGILPEAQEAAQLPAVLDTAERLAGIQRGAGRANGGARGAVGLDPGLVRALSSAGGEGGG